MPDVRLIDANALCEDREANDPVVIAAKCAPTIDAVPVVRCRECKYARPLVQEEWVECIMWRIGSLVDGFCDMGAKMDGGAENG